MNSSRPAIVAIAVIAAIAAIAGLILHSHQSGIGDTVAPTDPAVPMTAANPPAASDQTTRQPAERIFPTEVRLGSTAFKILAAQLHHYDAENAALKFTIRLKTNAAHDANVWDDSFRLLVDGVPLAPIGDGHSHDAEEGDVVFAIPSATRAVVLRIEAGDETKEIPIDLAQVKTS
jgi:hypothetical protein